MSTSFAASAALSLYFWPRPVQASSPVAAALSITNPRHCNPFPAKPHRPNPSPTYHVIRSSSSNSSSLEYNLEEQRWLREEQRWLREEQRWMREERRWNQERELLLQEIARLKLELGAVGYRARSIKNGEVVWLLKKKLVIEESGVSVRPLVSEENEKPEEQPKKIEESGSIKEKKKKGSQALRMGAEEMGLWNCRCGGSTAEVGILLGGGRHGLFQLLYWNGSCCEDMAGISRCERRWSYDS